MPNNLTSTKVRTNKGLSFRSLTLHKDANHKPEMAISLTPFSALCGFLPVGRIVSYLGAVPEFSGLIPATVRQAFIASVSSPLRETRKALKDLFTSLMTTEQALLAPALDALVRRYKRGQVGEEEKRLVGLVLKLEEQFPGDIGVFCSFVLNYVELEKGEAIFLGAGEPHAYVSGGRVEPKDKNSGLTNISQI